MGPLMTEAGAYFTLTKWVPALRSGNYVQGAGRLRTPDNKFCCLGVACDLLAQEGMGQWVLIGHGQYRFIYGYGDEEDAVLPEAVADSFGMTQDGYGIIKDSDEDVDEQFGPDLLTNANDWGVPFNTIADHLEIHANKSLKAIEAEREAMNASARQETQP